MQFQETRPIELLSPSLLLRLLSIRPDIREDVIKELKRRGIQVVEDKR